MKISIVFPAVMKVAFRAVEIELDDAAPLPEVKQKIFEVFWSTMERFSPTGRHGSPDQVILRDFGQNVITSNAELRDRIAKNKNFEVVFEVHHLIQSNPIKRGTVE